MSRAGLGGALACWLTGSKWGGVDRGGGAPSPPLFRFPPLARPITEHAPPTGPSKSLTPSFRGKKKSEQLARRGGTGLAGRLSVGALGCTHVGARLGVPGQGHRGASKEGESECEEHLFIAQAGR